MYCHVEAAEGWIVAVDPQLENKTVEVWGQNMPFWMVIVSLHSFQLLWKLFSSLQSVCFSWVSTNKNCLCSPGVHLKTYLPTSLFYCFTSTVFLYLSFCRSVLEEMWLSSSWHSWHLTQSIPSLFMLCMKKLSAVLWKGQESPVCSVSLIIHTTQVWCTDRNNEV